MAQDFVISIVIAPHSFLRGRYLKVKKKDSLKYNYGAMYIDKNHPNILNFGKKW